MLGRVAKRTSRTWAAVLVGASTIAGASSACIGQIGDGDGGEHGPAGVGPGASTAAFSPASARIRRLTRAQYTNALRDLLGGPIDLAPDDLEEDSERNGFAAIGASYVTISPRGVEQYEAAALAAAKQALGDATRREALSGCAPKDTVDEACTRAFLSKLGRRAFRRPMTDDELARWVSVATDAQTKLASFWEGLELATAGVLMSPSFLFRVEVGEPDPEHPGWLRYTGYELATRLSFFLRNTTPDDALLDAAERGELATASGLESHARRLLEGEQAHASLDEFFAELLHLAPLAGLTRDAAAFPHMSPTLGASMRGETLALFEDVVFRRDGDVRELFDSKKTFVNAELAKLYGLEAPSGAGFVAVTLPSDQPRVGIFGHASFLAVNAHVTRSSPTYRGKAIRERILCESMPPPPDDVPPLPDASSGDRATARQRLEMHRKVEPCKSCHQMMDPIGLGLENFDAIGAHRTEENGVKIDPSGDVDGAPFAGPRELAKLLRSDPRTGPCFARNLFRHAAGHVETKGEEPVIQAIVERFASGGYRVKSLALAIVTSDAFRYATPQGETP